MRKKILAVVLCLMTAVAFMPTFAFADATASAEFSSDYTKLIGKIGSHVVTVDTVKTFMNGGTGHNGMIKVEKPADDTVIDAAVAEDQTLGADATILANAMKDKTAEYYFDLTGAKIVGLGSKMTNDQFADFKLSEHLIKLVKPEGVALEDSTKIGEVERSTAAAEWGNYELTLDKGTFDPENKAAQNVTATVVFTAPSATGTYPVLKNGPVAKAVEVAAEPAAVKEAKDAKFYIDAVSETALNSGTTVNVGVQKYDGASHKIVMGDLAGYTVKYQKWNTKTAVWEDVNAIEWKDADTYKNYKAVVSGKKADGTADEEEFTFNQFSVAPATAKYQFKTLKDGSKIYTVKGAYDVKDYVKIAGTTDKDAAAIAANAAELKAYFEEMYVITETKVKDDFATYDEVVTLKIETPEGQDVAAINKKYKALLDNFTVSVVAGNDNLATLNVKDADLLENDVDFTKAPLSKTYKYKTLKKKSQKIQIEAVATSGVDCTYKLSKGGSYIKINKTTGKITVKKGLKKGTYKVTVKASVEEGNGYKTAANDFDLKIKVK